MSLQPIRKNMQIWRGATFRQQFTLLKDDLPTSLTNYTGELIIRESAQGTPLLTLTTANGGIVLTSEGRMDITISASATEAIVWNNGIYDFTITSPDNETTALLFGSFTVTGI